MNLNWHRWCYSSIAKHMENNRQGVNLFIEGEERDTSDLENHAELRIDGPDYLNPSKGTHHLDYEINVLVSVNMSEEDAYLIHRNLGIFQAAFTDKIDVFKYGTGPDDNQALLGCLIIQDYDHNHKIKTAFFGQIEPRTRVLQATVEALYRLTIEE